MLASVAKHYGFSLDTPFSELKPEHVRVIMHAEANKSSSGMSRASVTGYGNTGALLKA